MGWIPPRRPRPGQCPLCADTGEQWPDETQRDGRACNDEPRECPNLDTHGEA